jgi:hypothetical protein
MSRFTHDCDACEYLGTVEGPNVDGADEVARFDLYWCKRCDGGTAIARYGSEGFEYMSVPAFILERNLRSHPAILWAWSIVTTRRELEQQRR